MLRPALERQLKWRRDFYERDFLAAMARVELPDALARKFCKAAQELGRQFLFASRQRSRGAKTGDIGRHHFNPGPFCLGLSSRAVQNERWCAKRPSMKKVGAGGVAPKRKLLLVQELR
jgi:hypothetical protein